MKPQEAFIRNLINKHSIIVFMVVIVVLVFATVTFLDFRNKGKYDECKEACKDNRTCLEYKSGTGYVEGGCFKYSDGDCLNSCVQKYK